MPQLEPRPTKAFTSTSAPTTGGDGNWSKPPSAWPDALLPGELEPDSIDENSIAAELFTAGEQDPDLLIRTSGEYRISNFLLWQLAYAEIHVTDVLWPDFNAEAMRLALLDFQRRNRRFGGLDPIRP